KAARNQPPLGGGADTAADDSNTEQTPQPSDFQRLESMIAGLATQLVQVNATLVNINARLQTADARDAELRNRLTTNETAIQNTTGRLDQLERERTVNPPKSSFTVNPDGPEDDLYGQTNPPDPTAVIVGKVQKIPPDILVEFNPENGATAAYCENLHRL